MELQRGRRQPTHGSWQKQPDDNPTPCLAARPCSLALTNTGSHMTRLLSASLVRFRSQHHCYKAKVPAREREKRERPKCENRGEACHGSAFLTAARCISAISAEPHLAWPHHPHSSRSARVPDVAASPRRTSVLRLGTLSSSCVPPASVPCTCSARASP